MQYSHRLGAMGLLVAAALFLTANSGHGQVAKYAVYQLSEPDLTLTQVQRTAQRLKLTALPTPVDVENPMRLFKDRKGGVRLIFDPASGRLRYFADLTNKKGRAISRKASIAGAKKFLKKNALLPPDDQNLVVSEVITLAAQSAKKGGRQSKRRNVLRSVHFLRQLDGLPVYGPNSLLTVDESNQGSIGVNRTIRPLSGKRMPVDVISRAEADQLFERQFNVYFRELYKGNQASQYQVLSSELIYHEQGKQFIQPAFRYQVKVTNRELKGSTVFNWLVPAARQVPEAIDNVPRAKEGTFPRPIERDGGARVTGGPELHYGAYVVREDSDGWVDDAWGFHTNLESANFLHRFTGTGDTVTQFDQYYWNEPWIWEATATVPDNSPFFVGKVDTALIEGHGAPWLITTLKDCCDVIDLTKITGYGASNGTNGQTDFIVWQSCDVIPAPGDPFAGYWTSGSPFDVWWGIFEGMRGNYGYRTLMHIDNDAGKFFGIYAGLGMPALSAWFTACDDNIFGHGGNTNYGSAVIVTGHEGDSIYDTSPLAPPSSLTIWWQYQ